MTLDHYDEAAWLAWRMGGITATDIADAANGTYGGPFAVVARKLGRLPAEETTEAMDRGHRWQPVIADAVHVLSGMYVVGEETWCEHPDHPTHRATVDGFLATAAVADMTDLRALLEAKTFGADVRPNRFRWLDQVQWQMWVTGQPLAFIAAARIDDLTDQCLGLGITEVVADPDRQAALVDLAEELWAHVQADTLPPVDGAALDTVKALTATADPDADPVDLSDLADDLRRFHDIKAAVKAVTEERDALEARIRDAVGSATKGTAPGFRVSLSKPARVLDSVLVADLLAVRPDLGRLVLDTDRVRSDEPDLYDLARRPTGARRLTVTAKEN